MVVRGAACGGGSLRCGPAESAGAGLRPRPFAAMLLLPGWRPFPLLPSHPTARMPRGCPFNAGLRRGRLECSSLTAAAAPPPLVRRSGTLHAVRPLASLSRLLSRFFGPPGAVVVPAVVWPDDNSKSISASAASEPPLWATEGAASLPCAAPGGGSCMACRSAMRCLRCCLLSDFHSISSSLGIPSSALWVGMRFRFNTDGSCE
mmetsp:Transcript_7002/g.20507  ORF Transcript_7002/g.20507 Transcript_7002/m.20507 type:complete len:204 (-) Transcript_7002:1275-1886(-)